MRRGYRSAIGVTLTAGVLMAVSLAAEPALAEPAGAASADQPGAWTSARHDQQNTGHQPLPGRITEPDIKDQVHLGGSLSGSWIFDLDGDGTTELLSIEAGTLLAKNGGLDVVWSNAALDGVSTVVGMEDLDGNGAEELVVISHSGFGIAVLNPVDGTTLWSDQYAGALNLARVGFGTLDPSRPGLQIAVNPDRATHVTSYAFDQGVADGYVLWTSPDLGSPNPANFTASVVVADLDANGHDDVAIASDGFIETYDGVTGDALTTANGGWNGRLDYVPGPGVNGRNYGPFVAVPQPGSPHPLLVIAATSVNMHVQVVDNGPTGLSLRYDKFIGFTLVDDPTPNAVHVVQDSVGADLLGNGRPQLAISIYNDTGDGRWHTLVIDLLDGFAGPLLDVPDGYLRGVADLDGDGRTELMISTESGIAPGDGASPLTLYSPQADGTLAEVWSGIVGTFWAVRGDVTGTGTTAFFATQGSDLVGYHYAAGAVTEAWRHPAGQLVQVADFEADGSPEVVFAYPGGVIEVQDAATQEVLATGSIGGRFGQPTVATLTAGGPRSVIVPMPALSANGQTPAGEVRVFDWSSDGLVQRWTTPGVGLLPEGAGRVVRDVAKADNSVPLFDLDDDGNLELLVTDRAGNETRVRLLDADGTQRWAHTFSGADALGHAYMWVAGQFRPDAGKDIFVSGVTGGNNSEVSYILDGATGEVVWQQATIANPDTGAPRGFGPCCAYAAVARLLDPAALVERYASTGDLTASQRLRMTAALRAMGQATGRAVEESRTRFAALAAEVGDPQARATLLAAADQAGLDQVVLQARDVLSVVHYNRDTGAFQADAAGTVSNPVEGTLALYQSPTIADIDGDGTLDWLGTGGYLGLFAEHIGLGADGRFVTSPDWFVGTPEWDLYEFRTAVADVTGDGGLDAGLLHQSGVFESIDTSTGATQWSHPLGATGRSAATVDINGDGALDYVVGTVDGRLVGLNGAVGATDRELWSLDIGAPVGNVSIADVDGDGYSDIVFTAGDGFLYVVGPA